MPNNATAERAGRAQVNSQFLQCTHVNQYAQYVIGSNIFREREYPSFQRSRCVACSISFIILQALDLCL